MDRDMKKEPGKEPSSMEEILEERAKLEKQLHDEYRKEVTLLFTDICGYTRYIDTKGDIAGRTLLLDHNRIVLPLVEKHEGRVVEVSGDEVMACFGSPRDAVEAAVAVQEALGAHNRDRVPEESIRLKMGVHVGQALLDDQGAFQTLTGDVANVAARIQSQAGADEVLVSRSVYERVSGSDDIVCRFHGNVQVKGKAEPLELYRVVWREEDVVLSGKPKVRQYSSPAAGVEKEPLKVMEVYANRVGDHLTISAQEQIGHEKTTIRNYEQIPVSMEAIEARCHEMIETLNRANREGKIPREILTKLRDIGRAFYDELFSEHVKKKLEDTDATYLNLNLDDPLIHVPWELLNTGQQFLCQRFNMGRMVKTRQPVVDTKPRILARPLKMLVLADPTGDLEGALLEGNRIGRQMEPNKELVDVCLRSGKVTPGFVKEKLSNFDLVHFAGHADYNPKSPGDSGWRLTDGTLTAHDITGDQRTGSMPALVFSNACRSAHNGHWTIHEGFQDEIFGLANAFLISGVRHYVGTCWEIMDETSGLFSTAFYQHLLSGRTMGEALRLARREVIEEHGEESIVWASYILYGDPTSNYLDARADKEPEAEHVAAPGSVEVREGTDRAQPALKDEDAARQRRRGRWAALTVATIALVAGLLWGAPAVQRHQVVNLEKEALAYYGQGNFEGALQACSVLENKSPDSVLPGLVRGRIHLRRGNLQAAEGAYRGAVQADKGTDAQRVEAMMGLGRVFSLRDEPEAALEHYRQATVVAPDSTPGYLSQALLLEKSGELDQALGLLAEARDRAPDDPMIAALADETRDRVAFAQDKEKREHVDRMIKELVENMESQPKPVVTDGWTSLPLTMWAMDLKKQGYSLQEGQDRLLLAGIVDHMIRNGRVRMVERALFDKLAEELKLGSSQLVDRSTALSLGRLLAARLILFGEVIYAESQTQLTMRLIETETGLITASMTETFGSADPTPEMVAKVAQGLLEKLDELYPLRGKVSRVSEEEVQISIGQRAGARQGHRFAVLDRELVLEVTSVQPDTSLAWVIEGDGVPEEGDRVQAN